MTTPKTNRHPTRIQRLRPSTPTSQDIFSDVLASTSLSPCLTPRKSAISRKFLLPVKPTRCSPFTTDTLDDRFTDTLSRKPSKLELELEDVPVWDRPGFIFPVEAPRQDRIVVENTLLDFLNEIPGGYIAETKNEMKVKSQLNFELDSDGTGSFLDSMSVNGEKHEPPLESGSLGLPPTFNFDAFQVEEEYFGFGSFSDMFITEEDLKRAQEKLPEEEIKTSQETMSDYQNKLDPFIIPKTSAIQESAVHFFTGVILAYNHISMGIGTLLISTGHLCWLGTLLCLQNRQEIALQFPFSQLSDVREKTMDDEARISVTVKDTMFLQFLFQNIPGSVSECKELILREISKCRKVFQKGFSELD
ncbi:hypothetical protein HK096_005216, partial [Nowakowskiella sp. JEL0078]